MSKGNGKQRGLLNWNITPWRMDGQGGWLEQPIIIVEKRTPFFADHPQAYIDKLNEMHDDLTLLPGNFWTLIGQFQDGLEQYWEMSREERRANEKGIS